ncbi:sensor histidine kinase [Streptomyces sp. SID11385]|uniref:sensor histidine kinase n=1 Tax=Streptomyces sp. SID11385 TaxID=2706031 RepID=UPI0013C82B35|nr:sensor histidine kinase [Streptomyces sp. SID11385]NEA42529.1 HAMP domain-containing protein [Streptomyces sp. SID11385]
MTAPQQHDAPPAGRPSRWTTRKWVRAGGAVALVLLALLGGIGVWAMGRASSLTGTLVDGHSPALTNAVRLEAALVNQETGVRGYGLTGERRFLEPYERGLADEKTAVARLRTLVDDGRNRADLDRVLARTRTWQGRIAHPVAAAPGGAPVPLAAARAAEGKSAFDAVRRALTTQQDHLKAARADAVEELRAAERLRDGVFLAIGVILVLLALAVFEGLRRGVTDPLDRLSADTGRVTRGDFAHRIRVSGPADLRRLGADVESMRHRLAAELATSEERRLLLDEQTADLKRSNEELEQFAYIASHDLQEPLRKVSSFTQLLQRRYAGELDARADQYIAFAVDGANRMQVLINDLLAFSRIGRLTDKHERVDLDALVGRTLDTLGMAIEEAGARITRDALPAVTGDPTQLGMLWQNLLSNAVKFRSPERPPEIRVGVAPEGDAWRFTVTDNGIGIEPEYAERVFVIFQRLHTKDTYPGSGIGLAICKKVVEYHGGTISLTPAEGPGTAITFTLPRRAGDGADTAAAETVPHAAVPRPVPHAAVPRPALPAAPVPDGSAS